MQQLSKIKSVLFHLYPGIIIALCFALVTPYLVKQGFPPQLGSLLAIVIVAIPLLLAHLLQAKKKEHKKNVWELNVYKNRLSTGKLILYALGLVLLMFLIWGITQPVDKIITEKIFSWLPAWYTVQDFKGYSKQAIELTLVVNLLLNGFIAPFIEEYYFRGYLLPRMAVWGNWAFVINTILFSLYHFWQPYVYLTLIIALLPMIYLVWKTKDLRLAILTHSLLNIVGALLSFGLLMK
jgi:membrane protease YdiL (CAAX protease family)